MVPIMLLLSAGASRIMSSTSALENLVRDSTRVAQAPLVPEIQLHLAEQVVPLWQRTELCAGRPQAPPFWAFAWPGSQALARYLLDNPQTVERQRVLDLGAGGGLAALAAARAGAGRVTAIDVDPLAAVAQRLNAQLNGVQLETWTGDPTQSEPMDADVVLAGDVCYDRAQSPLITDWLWRTAGRGAAVLLADPGRAYAPIGEMYLLASYDVPTLFDLESCASRLTRLWRLGASRPHPPS
jgi:predicted nicotinamide N-methyase